MKGGNVFFGVLGFLAGACITYAVGQNSKAEENLKQRLVSAIISKYTGDPQSLYYDASFKATREELMKMRVEDLKLILVPANSWGSDNYPVKKLTD